MQEKLQRNAHNIFIFGQKKWYLCKFKQRFAFYNFLVRSQSLLHLRKVIKTYKINRAFNNWCVFLQMRVAFSECIKIFRKENIYSGEENNI